MANGRRHLHYLSGRSATLSCNWIPTKSASNHRAVLAAAAAAIPTFRENDFKEEHYRRIAYANEHYASGIPGWKTDRGRMYIMVGARRMKLNRTRQAALTTGPWKRAAARRQLIRGKRGAGAIWKASAKHYFWNSSIPAARVNITC